MQKNGSYEKRNKWQLYKTTFLILIVLKSKNRSNGIVYMLHIIQSLVHDIDSIKEGKEKKENIALRCFHNIWGNMMVYKYIIWSAKNKYFKL